METVMIPVRVESKEQALAVARGLLHNEHLVIAAALLGTIADFPREDQRRMLREVRDLFNAHDRAMGDL
jgi:hypothetical protein